MSKKTKYTLVKVIVALCVVLCVVLTAFEMSATYRLMKAAEVDGTEYSVAEYNWYYTNSVYEIYNSYYSTYGDLAQYIFNPQGGLEDQVYNQETGETWADYVKAYTDDSLVELTKLYNEGKEAGFVLEDEFIEAIDAEWDALEEVAKEYGYTTKSYVEMSYGRGVNEKVFKEMYERYYFAIEYAGHISDSVEVSKEDIDAYYSEHSEDFDNVSFKSYFVSGSAAEGEDAETAMNDAKAEAEAVLSGEKEVEFTENKYYVYSETNTLYADWVFDSARTAGDKEIFESESGYYVVEFVSENDLHYNTINVRHILIAPGDSTSEESLAAAEEKANLIVEEWKSKGATEEAFAELAMVNSVDSSSANGGLYENVFKGQMVTEFEDWCFDSARKVGDVEVIKTSYGYHVMYFCGEAEEYYDYIIDLSIRSEELNSHIDSLVEGAEVSDLFGSRYIGKHFA
ncbi:MAG: hypothetical protein E7479_04700 [Ruminococcaceae bacterium]|nr:hypothetical protein [Oscillospiraceae bacterium]